MKQQLHNRILQLVIAVLFILNSNDLYSQNSYSFSLIDPGTVPYNEITNDSIVTNFATSNVFDITQLYGETFYFYGIPFTFGPNAIVTVGKYNNLAVFTDSTLIIFDAANAKLDSINPTSKKSYSITGGPGMRLLKIQYKNLKLTNGAVGNYVNLQIWYYQQTGIVEYHYGPRSSNNANGFTTSNGPQIGTFYSKNDFSSCYEKLWIKGTPSSIVLDTIANYNFFAMTGIPDSGTVFRFTPRFNTTGIQNLKMKNDNTILFPNPASEFIKIENSKNEKLQIEIYSSIGEIILSKQIQNPETLSINSLSAGVYFVKIISEDKSVTTKKIQIIK